MVQQHSLKFNISKTNEFVLEKPPIPEGREAAFPGFHLGTDMTFGP